MKISTKKRRIIDYKKLSPEQIELLEQQYGEEDREAKSIRFRNAKGDLITALPIETEESILLVKMGVLLRQKLEEIAIEYDNKESYENDDDEDQLAKLERQNPVF